jgi:23S rRNA (uracil1939-C5)-methyltransferase
MPPHPENTDLDRAAPEVFDPGVSPIFGDPSSAPRRPRRDDRFELELAGLTDRGAAHGRAGSYTVELRGALPGDRVLARVQRRRRDRIDAHALERLSASPDRVAPVCRHTADCGGCSFQELSYARQLVELHALASRQLAPLDLAGAGLSLPPVRGAERRFGYRNKMDFTFASKRWKEREDDGRREDFALGLHARGRHDKGLDVLQCELMFAGGLPILETVRERALALELEPWDLELHTGFLRHLVLRRGQRTGELLVDLVTSADDAPGFAELCRAVLDRHPEVTTLVQNVTTRLSTVAVGEREHVLHGPGVIHEELGGRRFRLSANSFFQTNTEQAEVLVARAAEFLRPGRVLWDLYCGTGTFGLCLAERFERVVGIELVESAVRDARVNAELNAVEHAAFHVGDAAALLADEARRAADLPSPDAAVVDPPRAGLHPKVVAALVEHGPPQLLYVSCNLKSAARDLPPLLAAGYRLVGVECVDLFPHTPHLEGVFSLERGPRETAGGA